MFNRIWRGWMNFTMSLELAKASRQGKKIETFNDGSESTYVVTINR